MPDQIKNMKYNFKEIEERWKTWWTNHQVYKVPNKSPKPKYYILDMFPYPSGAGLHVGHPLGYIASDIFARYKRQQGYNVLHPMGYDAFGLPAEQYAIQTGVHPAESTATNISRYREQLDKIGFSFDWDRQVQTSDPSYYKWTQWIFLQLFNHWYCNDSETARPIEELIRNFESEGNIRTNAATTQDVIFTAEQWLVMTSKEKDNILMNYRLAYRKTTYVWWCEHLGTVLANDEVKNGLSERGGYSVERKSMTQWSLRITAYANRLLNDLDTVDFSDAMKKMQGNWIGKSEGVQISFGLENSNNKIEVFTTKPDTILNATFIVIAPEHDLVRQITTPAQVGEITDYLTYVNTRSERDRMSETKEISGAFTGTYAINPFSGTKMPVWVAEYVLKDYGTGAIMAVPSEDERDMRFAKKFGLPVVQGIDTNVCPDVTTENIVQRIKTMGVGIHKTNFRLRDAIYSRQRYWGEPFPIIYDTDGVAHDLPIEELPLELPELDNFKPVADAKSPLDSVDSWVNFKEGWYRETDTMPGFAGSSWYFLRYMDPTNGTQFASKEALEYWQDVDLYVGGTEHAVGHLMYSRFWHKFLYDKGLVPTKEPYKKLLNQGMIQGKSAIMEVKNDAGKTMELHVPVKFVNEDWQISLTDLEELKTADNRFENVQPGVNTSIINKVIPLSLRIEKMSKSLHNVVNPDEVVERYGADCFRMYEMFLGPIEQAKPWDTKGISGISSFLRKLWMLFFDESSDKYLVTDTEPTKEEWRILHSCIKRVTDDIERFSFNTCVSAFMTCVNELRNINCSKQTILNELVRLIAPFAPFIAEELWHQLGHETTVCDATYPEVDESYLVQDTVQYPISIDGRKRDVVELPVHMSLPDLEKLVLGLNSVKKWLEGKSVKKVIVVPNRMVNIVTS